MAKKITGYIKLQVPAGKANPAPPIGPALGQHGVNIMEFCKAFNAKTAQMDPDLKIPVVITVFADRSFTFETSKKFSSTGVDRPKIVTVTFNVDLSSLTSSTLPVKLWNGPDLIRTVSPAA